MLSTECENLKMRIDEEADKKNDALKALSKAQAEIQLWKSKYETEALGRIDELEGGKAKLASRVMEAEETIDSLNTKIAATEKSKHRLETELEEIAMEYERTHAAAVITEKRAHNFDKVVGEWKCKADDLMAELDACRPPMTRWWSSWMWSAARTRTSPMRSRTCWTSWETEVAPSTSWTSRGAVWRWRRRSCRPPWRRPRVLWRLRRTRC